MKKVLGLALVIMMALSLFACTTPPNAGTEGSAAPAAAPSEGKPAEGKEEIVKTVLNIGLNSNVIGLDPLNQSSNPARAITFAVFEPLVEFDHKGTGSTFTPCLATEWSVDDTGCVWTFKLREGVKFHNGEDLTSADVVSTYRRILDEGGAISITSQFWAYLADAVAVDDYTVQIVLSQPFASMLISVAFTPIMPDEAFAEYGEDFWNNQVLYGTGPWKFDEWVDGAYTHLVKNDGYWGEYDTDVQELYIRFLTEVSTAIASHLVGDLDAYIVNGGIDQELLPLYNDYLNTIELITMDTANFIYMGFHCKDSAFADQDVRLAWELAIDRQTLCDTIYSGNASVPNSVVLPMLDGYNPNLAPYPYEPDRAKELLAGSTYDGHEIVIYTTNTLNKGKDQSLAISEMLNQVGFNTTVEVVESAVLQSLRKTADYEVFLMNDLPMGGDLAKYFMQKILQDNHKHEYQNDEMMTLVDNILTELDAAKRAELISQYAAMSREVSAPHTILYYLRQTQAVNYGVKNLEIWDDTCYSFKFVDFDSTLIP